MKDWLVMKCLNCNAEFDGVGGYICCLKCRFIKQENKDSTEIVNHPRHYNTGKIEVIEFIEDQRLGMHLGNCVKYVARAGKKDPAKKIEDLEKGLWYLKRKIELLKATEEKRAALRPNEMPPAH